MRHRLVARQRGRLRRGARADGGVGEEGGAVAAAAVRELRRPRAHGHPLPNVPHRGAVPPYGHPAWPARLLVGQRERLAHAHLARARRRVRGVAATHPLRVCARDGQLDGQLRRVVGGVSPRVARAGRLRVGLDRSGACAGRPAKWPHVLRVWRRLWRGDARRRLQHQRAVLPRPETAPRARGGQARAAAGLPLPRQLGLLPGRARRGAGRCGAPPARPVAGREPVRFRVSGRGAGAAPARGRRSAGGRDGAGAAARAGASALQR
mmetsp:Transcript_27212/g.85432  ORF Transcript_27212/g.85432 Transcript_27212/m.85432 type:complete len:265 (+) Transcript_27212:692-1486(+)